MSCSRIGLALILAVSHLLLLSMKIAPVSSFVHLSSQTSLTKTVTGRITESSPTSPCRMASKSTEENAASKPTEGNAASKPTEGKVASKPKEGKVASKPKEGNPEIKKQLERAKAAIAISRAKMEAREQAEAGLDAEEKKEKSDEKAVPFFAMTTADDNSKKDKVIKNTNEDGGFTTDGALMAKLSEEEEWESRSLLDVFTNEKEKPDAMNINRDIGASMYNLRKTLQTEDFMRIFDKRNHFIGEP
jgi:hypothetical protein